MSGSDASGASAPCDGFCGAAVGAGADLAAAAFAAVADDVAELAQLAVLTTSASAARLMKERCEAVTGSGWVSTR